MNNLSLLIAMSLLASSAVGRIVNKSLANSHANDLEAKEEHPGDEDYHMHFTNEWVVKLNGGPEIAKNIAEEMGYSYEGVVPGLRDTYVLVKNDHPKRHKREATHISKQLFEDKRILWSEQQLIKRRTKRDFIEPEVDPEMKVNQRKRPYLDFPKGNPDYSFEYQSPYDNDDDDYDLESEYQDEIKNIDIRGGLNIGLFHSILWNLMDMFKISDFNSNRKSLFNDRFWHKQWYMHYTQTSLDARDSKAVDSGAAKNTTRSSSEGPIRESLKNLIYRTVDMNVLPCYAEHITGKGIRVSILDDGIERTHVDLIKNYDREISRDVNDNDDDPTPQYNGKNSHGTRCAGEVAMEANNGRCGVGIAYNARIGGVRLLDGPVTDRTEASAVGHANHLVDIYSASWGPTDDGTVVDGPGRLVREALLNGVTIGRNGKGSIFVWASGNGGGQGDSCSCDGYVNSIYTLTVSSVTQGGKVPWYGEKCAATFTTTYSSGSIREQMIVATDLNNQCTDTHSGTSAAAPIAAGIVALLLEANPNLTWRDVQHIVVLTSRAKPLMAKSLKGWKANGAGFYVNTRFGFGLMDAHAMVLAGREWVTVPEQQKCTMPFEIADKELMSGETVRVKIPMECKEVQYLEHVVLELNINAAVRGTIEVYLESPMGTKVQMLYTRYRDRSKNGYKNWPVLSVFTWNENPNGEWTMEVVDTCKHCPAGKVGDITFSVFGTTEKPHYFRETIVDKLTDTLNELAMEDHSDEDSFFSLFEMRNLLKQLL